MVASVAVAVENPYFFGGKHRSDLVQEPAVVGLETRYVDIYRQPDTEATWVDALRRCSNLTHLCVRGQCRQRLFDALTEQESITHLHIDQARNLELGAVSTLQQLRALTIMGTVKSFAPVYRLSQLENCYLGASKSVIDFASLGTGDWPSLRGLWLLGSGFSNPANFNGWEGLRHLPALEYLFVGTPAPGVNRNLSALSELPNLQHVEVGSLKQWQKDGLARLERAGVLVTDLDARPAE